MLKKFYLIALFLILGTQNSNAGEKSLYDFLWLDPDKKVYVLQNKLYKKENTFYMDVGYLTNFSSKFQDTSGFTVRGGYFVHEDWGLEVFYNQYSNSDNDDWRNVRLVNGVDPFVRRFNSSVGAMGIWSPFYGKINTFNKIFYFDLSFGAGFAKVSGESNRKTVQNPSGTSRYESESYNAVVWKTNTKFHISENLHVGVEWMQHHFNARGPSRQGKEPAPKMRVNQDLIITVGFSF